MPDDFASDTFVGSGKLRAAARQDIGAGSREIDWAAPSQFKSLAAKSAEPLSPEAAQTVMPMFAADCKS